MPGRRKRALCVLLLLLGGAACGASEPIPTGSPVQSARPTAAEPSAGEPARLILSDALWYEVNRIGNLQGNLANTLLIGSLDGTLRSRIPLGAQAPAERRDGREAFAWTDPQADGIFGHHVLVWGRDGQATTIEAVDVRDGSIEVLVNAEATVHVATADASLTHAFFITVDEASNQPTALWAARLGDDPTRLAYEFATDPVTNLFTYRLVASADGSLVAIQPGVEGEITLIEVEANQAKRVQPGGPMIGFTDRHLIAYGALSATENRPLIAFDLETLDGQIIAEEVSSAQVVAGTDGELIAAMRTDPADPRSFEVAGIAVGTGESSVAYTQDPAELGPQLASRDRHFLGAELPPDWVLLGDSFVPFIEDPSRAPKDVPLSRYPKLLNLRTGETVRVGPFVEDPD